MKQRDYILLDRSGSMGFQGKWQEAVGAIDGYVKKLREEGVDTLVDFIVFDTNDRFQVVRAGVSPVYWSDNFATDIGPRGGTPLNDAIVELCNRAFKDNPEKAAIIVVTDGEENSSLATYEQAKSLLDEAQKRGWGVLFLGAQFDNSLQARSLGIGGSNTAYVAAGKMSAALNFAASTRSAYSKGLVSTMEYTSSQKEELAKED
jgi:hypothetical protein